MEQEIMLLIERFLSMTEYANTEIPTLRLVITKNIYDYVLHDDPEYAKKIKGDVIYGLYCNSVQRDTYKKTK